MIRPKVYLDTSVISHLLADDTPEKRDDTRKLWEELKIGEYEVISSSVVAEEIGRCASPLREELAALLRELRPTLAHENEETIALANEYLANGVLSKKSYDDLRHIAISGVYRCKYILSWNFKHFVKASTIEAVNEVNRKLNYGEVLILPPTMFLKGDEDDG